ncbi:hypothetical protein Zmor_001462 [Zophobas morio]|uniref:Major facilitator superfamily (MFS) profile domain-containing protein n=1 Tax=Zophobas morio TaxID=2755281 RepID=A0AA38IZ39_9CUCU|nr:hypothetical protein Zmor_001462 [Zophobas morio]
MKKFDLDEILVSLGGWGKFQSLYYLVLCSAIIFSVFPAMNYIFIARDIKYRCKIDSCDKENGQFNPDWLENAVPFEQHIPSKCSYYEPEENSTCSNFNLTKILRCDDYVYERDETTLVHDFDIKCDENLWKLTIIGTINVVGKLLCLPLAGFFSDRFGRKSMIIVSVFLSTVIGLIRSFSFSYYMYIGLEFLNTVVGSGVYSGAFILALELVDSKRRNLGNSIICLAFTVGHILLGVAAWVSPTWQFMTQITYAPGILVTLLLWFTPESVRWLISKNKNEKAEKVLKTIAKVNGKELTEETIKNIPYIEQTDKAEENETIPLMAILRKKSLLIRIIHCSFTWICCNFPYYGLTIQSVALSHDIYVNYMCVSVVEIPAYILAYGSLDRIGRKKTLALSLIFTGIACISVDFIPAGSPLALVVFLSGKLFVTVSYMTIYIYTAELFPTSSRHSAFAVCSMFGCVGSMLAPQVPLLAKVYKPLPLMVFSAMAFTAGFLSFLFPEQNEGKNPDEIDKS